MDMDTKESSEFCCVILYPGTIPRSVKDLFTRRRVESTIHVL